MFNFSDLTQISLQKKIDLLELVKENQYNIPEKGISGIYIIYNVDNDKFYFGKSKDVLSRLTRHRNDLFANRHRNKKLQDDFNNMKTEESFIGCLIQEVDESQLQAAEHYYIKYFSANITGYNVQLPSEGETK